MGDVLTPVAQKWDGLTFYIPHRVENTAPTARRFQFFLAVERNVRGATARNETKFNCMASQVDIGATVKLDLCDSTKDWLDPDSLQPKLVRTSIFKFTDGRGLTAYGKDVKGYTKNWTNTAVDGVMEHMVNTVKRSHLRFVSTLLKVKPPWRQRRHSHPSVLCSVQRHHNTTICLFTALHGNQPVSIKQTNLQRQCRTP